MANKRLPDTGITREILSKSKNGKEWIIRDAINNLLTWAKDNGLDSDQIIADEYRKWFSRK